MLVVRQVEEYSGSWVNTQLVKIGLVPYAYHLLQYAIEVYSVTSHLHSTTQPSSGTRDIHTRIIAR